MASLGTYQIEPETHGSGGEVDKPGRHMLVSIRGFRQKVESACTTREGVGAAALEDGQKRL